VWEAKKSLPVPNARIWRFWPSPKTTGYIQVNKWDKMRNRRLLDLFSTVAHAPRGAGAGVLASGWRAGAWTSASERLVVFSEGEVPEC